MSDQKANVLSYIERLRKPAGVPPFIQREAADILQWHVDALEAKDKDREFWDARWAEKTKRLEARVAELEAVLREAGKEIETRPMVRRSIDYANGFRIGAQCQRLHAQSVAKQALGERDDN